MQTGEIRWLTGAAFDHMTTLGMLHGPYSPYNREHFP